MALSHQKRMVLLVLCAWEQHTPKYKNCTNKLNFMACLTCIHEWMYWNIRKIQFYDQSCLFSNFGCFCSEKVHIFMKSYFLPLNALLSVLKSTNKILQFLHTDIYNIHVRKGLQSFHFRSLFAQGVCTLSCMQSVLLHRAITDQGYQFGSGDDTNFD